MRAERAGPPGLARFPLEGPDLDGRTSLELRLQLLARGLQDRDRPGLAGLQLAHQRTDLTAQALDLGRACGELRRASALHRRELPLEFRPLQGRALLRLAQRRARCRRGALRRRESLVEAGPVPGAGLHDDSELGGSSDRLSIRLLQPLFERAELLEPSESRRLGPGPLVRGPGHQLLHPSPLVVQGSRAGLETRRERRALLPGGRDHRAHGGLQARQVSVELGPQGHLTVRRALLEPAREHGRDRERRHRHEPERRR